MSCSELHSCREGEVSGVADHLGEFQIDECGFDSSAWHVVLDAASYISGVIRGAGS